MYAHTCAHIVCARIYLGKFVLNARRLRPVITSRRRRNYESDGRALPRWDGRPFARCRHAILSRSVLLDGARRRSFENPRRVWRNGGNYVLHKRHALPPARPSLPFCNRGWDGGKARTPLCVRKFSAKVRQTSNSKRVESDSPPPTYATAICLKRTHLYVHSLFRNIFLHKFSLFFILFRKIFNTRICARMYMCLCVFFIGLSPFSLYSIYFIIKQAINYRNQCFLEDY